MHLVYLDRARYRRKMTAEVIEPLRDRFGRNYGGGRRHRLTGLLAGPAPPPQGPASPSRTLRYRREHVPPPRR
jgi:hypothetical protein